MTSIIVWLTRLILALMLLLSPGKEHTVIAAAIAEVVAAEPALFPEDSLDANKRLTLALVIAIAFREGSFKESVIGDCTLKGSIERVPCKTPGAIAHSFCTMQVHDSMGGSDWLNENPLLCIKTGLRILRQSVKACHEHPVAVYASGPSGCDNRRARGISRDRMSLARWLATHTIELLPDFDIVHPDVPR